MSHKIDGLVLIDICLRSEITVSMNMDIELNSNSHSDATNALEVINLKLQQEIPENSYLKNDFRSWVENKKRLDLNIERISGHNEKFKNNVDNENKNAPFITFQRSMKLLLIYGQVVGLNPVTAIWNYDITKIRFRYYSWRFIYTVIIGAVQTFVAVVSIYKILASGVSIKSLVYWCLSLDSLWTTIIFVRIASKWQMLVNEIFNCNLDKYINKGIIFKCNVFSIVFLILAIVEYVVYSMWEISDVIECAETLNYDTFEIIVMNGDPAVFEIGIPYNIPTAIVLQVNNVFTSANWTFSDIYIICISLYLTSILTEINKKILCVADKKYLSPSIWGTLREDYNRATRLIRRFDDVFSGLVLLSFATNLFWICVQIFNVLDNGISPKYKSSEICPHRRNTPFLGYERSIYVVYSLTFLIVRFTTMCLVAASVNIASSVPAAGLYRVPSCAYSMEVQRFLDQVQDEVVALTGMKYFYITRELVISMAGTILTYELVLLQLSSEELLDSLLFLLVIQSCSVIIE